jgi:hypothetical protein
MPRNSPELLREYPFILITGQRHDAFCHSGDRYIVKLRKLCLDPVNEIHRRQAAKPDMDSGEWVWIEASHIEESSKKLWLRKIYFWKWWLLNMVVGFRKNRTLREVSLNRTSTA